MLTPPDSPIDPLGLGPPKLPQVFSDDEEEKDSIAVSSDGEHGSSANEFYGIESDEDISEGVDNDTNDGNNDRDDGEDGDSNDCNDGEDGDSAESDDGEDGDSDANGPPSKHRRVDDSSEDGGGLDDDDAT
ncbi:prostatic spermine-binding protein-like [Setaria italica]|uniref:prostatic spermine-binding protein-like n=1 Tax=Setaria italica TaxID=4555 RepID=UPI0006484F46|nr:prostatic spermine-binding protein-like [Setaria italica]